MVRVYLNINYFFDLFTFFSYSLGYQSFMLSLKSQISILDNFVIREESITPVLALMNKDASENSHNTSDSSTKEVNIFLLKFKTYFNLK